ncbi:MAG: hypothetical protein AB7T31_16395 [Gemmatimonadales bacterium]
MAAFGEDDRAESAGPTPESKPHRWEAPVSRTGRPVCDLCGYAMRESHCKLVCDQCGYTRDCSDP